MQCWRLWVKEGTLGVLVETHLRFCSRSGRGGVKIILGMEEMNIEHGIVSLIKLLYFPVEGIEASLPFL